MADLTAQHAFEFFRRSYTAVDGLWFMKAEAQFGFEAALALDEAVWQVMPKIQARALKAVTGQARGLAALRACLTTRLRWEEYSFEIASDDDGQGFTLTIRACPWHRLLVKSGREGLASQIGPRICGSEYPLWAAEFGDDIRCELGPLICLGAGACVVRFRQEGGEDEDAS